MSRDRKAYIVLGCMALYCMKFGFQDFVILPAELLVYHLGLLCWLAPLSLCLGAKLSSKQGGIL